MPKVKARAEYAGYRIEEVPFMKDGLPVWMFCVWKPRGGRARYFAFVHSSRRRRWWWPFDSWNVRWAREYAMGTDRYSWQGSRAEALAEAVAFGEGWTDDREPSPADLRDDISTLKAIEDLIR